MEMLRVGFIGTGRKKERRDALGYYMAYEHGEAYQSIEGCEIVACADIVEENARAFADAHGFSDIYSDYREMLAKANLDAVSICTWPHLHEPMVLDAVEAGVRVIHCEKPMADTWRGAARMAKAAKEKGCQLTFNHQRRYGAPFKMAKDLIDRGEIGDLQRFECDFGNIYDTGTHFIDMLSFYMGDRAKAKWVLAQIDYREENKVFGAPCENQQVLLFEYDNGVFGFVYGGAPGGRSPLGVVNRIVGSEGVIDVGAGHGPDNAIRWRKQGDTEWRTPDTGGASIHGPGFIQSAIRDVIDCYRSGRKCQLSAENALVATEIIFGAYESSRKRGRVDFPLSEEIGNPLREMVESGDLKPEPAA
jgi:predicted dehydrogenase